MRVRSVESASMCDTASSVLNTRSTAPVVMLTTSSAWLPSAVTTTLRRVDPAHVVRRAVLAEIDRLDRVAARQRDHAQRLLLPDALLVVVGDQHRAAIRRHRRFVRPGDDRHVPIRLHRLQIDQRHRVGLLVDGDDGAGETGRRAGVCADVEIENAAARVMHASRNMPLSYASK